MNYIVIDSAISSGAPIIKGRRITVFNIVSKIYYEQSLDVALDDYDISISIAKQAVEYCSNLICQQDTSLIKFCSGCILRTLQDGWDFKKRNYNEINYDAGTKSITISKDGNEIFLGSIQELEDNHFGKVGWLLAADNKAKYLELNNGPK